MDKLSTKLRLVRSQSMGVGMGGAANGGVNGEKAAAAAAAMRRTPSHLEGRQAAIVLLDERRLEMLIQPRLYAGELLDLVASHCNLKEKEYFGLAVVDESGHYTWLQLDRKVLDHDLPRKPSTLTVHFLVKFFIESMAHLVENKTIELFYLQARSLIFRGTLEVESEIVFQLAALALQSSSGDYADETLTRSLLKRSPILPANVLKEHPSLTYCEDQVIEHYKKMRGQTRGQAVVNYMTIVESMPTYGVHYFEVYDKRQMPWWLGLSCRGIAQYAYGDRKVPVRVFPWKQLENLYFRDKKFSIEVHDAKRVVQTLSSFNLYEDALKLDSSSPKDELVDAIADSTTQVSVSRRSFNPGAIHVYVWFGKTQGLTKCIWQSAISQHQFYLDRKQAKLRHQPPRTLKDIARDLTRSSASLSSASSLSNLSRTESSLSLAGAAGGAGGTNNSSSQSTLGGAGSMTASSGGGTTSSAAPLDPEAEALRQRQSEEAKRARMEMVTALKARREALEAKLKDKQKLLKELCIKEGELTGELPPEIPLAPGEPVPQIRRRVGTEFTLSEKTVMGNTTGHALSPEEELLAGLELEHEIQSKITSAALKLANDASASKSVRKQRKINYQQSLRKLKEIETKLNALKYYGTKHKRKQPRPDGDNHSAKDLHMMSVGAGGQRDIRRGMSVPDLDISVSISDSRTSLDDQDDLDETDAVSPKSCPASPRKNANGGGGGGQQGAASSSMHPDSVSLESSPQRLPRSLANSGYIPSSVYLRNSYRSKQFPTLSGGSSSSTARPLHMPGSSGAPLLATTDMMMLDSSSSTASVSAGPTSRSATLPTSPFKNKYESHLTQCDSPVGLYNCPQQRTSQAFSSMDDLDAMLTSNASASALPSTSSLASAAGGQALGSRIMPVKPGLFPVRLEAAAQGKNYPSLERSIRKQSRAGSNNGAPPPFGYNPAMANRELPALPMGSSANTALSTSALSKLSKQGEAHRSMEDLDSLEAAGIRGRSKMQYREVLNGDTVSLADAMLSKMNMAGSRPHHLPNTDEYPAHHSPSARGSHNMLGIRPLDTGGPYPTPHGTGGGTLLPGQTYPEPSAKPAAASSIPSLQDVVFYSQRASSASTTNSTTTITSNSRRVETTFGLNDTVRTESLKEERRETTTLNSGRREESPPPLFPKQYHQVVEQRRRSGIDLGNTSNVSSSSAALVAAVAAMPVPPRAIVSESPAVNRKVKPVLATPPPLPPISSSVVVAKMNDSFDAAIVPDSPSKGSITSIASSRNSGAPPPPAPSMSLAAAAAQASANANNSGPFHRESTKPFEMSDFYKYSTKFRKQSSSSIKSASDQQPPQPMKAQHQQDLANANSESDSPRSSTASGSGSSGPLGPPEVPSRTPTKGPRKDGDNNVIGGDLADDFASEMIAWYNSNSNNAATPSTSNLHKARKVAPVPPAKPKAQPPPSSASSTTSSTSSSGKPATLV